jgi:putative Mn2+ efflux pump MntP
MDFVELLLIGVGLSMDAFAVAICKGLGMSRLNMKQAAVIALFFGAFQAIMPFIGWAAGSWLADLITPIDHWVAFALLAFVGGKMLWDAFHEEDDDDPDEMDAKLDLKELLMLAIATSIDALAVGITFAFLQVSIVPSITIIGCTTFVISFAGVAVGHLFGARFEKPATIVGGVVLILIGVKILLEHLGILVL